jgi:hypothetical protein
MKENEAKKITIPAINEYPFEKVEKWAKGYYRKAETQVDSQRAKKIKDSLPIEMASYDVKMTFGFWRLMGPAFGRPDKEAPLTVALDFIKPYAIKSQWGQIKPKFAKQLRTAFKAICNSDYNPEMVKEVNKDIADLLATFAKEVSCQFVLHPETAESYDSPKILGIRSKIWEHFTGKPLDLSLYPTEAVPIPGRPIQMEMYLDISVQ